MPKKTKSNGRFWKYFRIFKLITNTLILGMLTYVFLLSWWFEGNKVFSIIYEAVYEIFSGFELWILGVLALSILFGLYSYVKDCIYFAKMIGVKP